MSIGKIVVVNKRTHQGEYIYIGRGSAFGNPFPESEYGRDGCIEKFLIHMELCLKQQKKNALRDGMNDIAQRVMKGETVYLGCFCKPKACHGDVIKNRIDHEVANYLTKQAAKPDPRSIIIAGSRGITDIDVIYDAIKASGFKVEEVVSGTAKGVDKLGELWAEENDVGVVQFPADWKDLSVPGAVIKQNRYGKYNAIAGHQRNAKMAEYADGLIAIWDGESKGTKNMIDTMQRLNKPVYVYRVQEEP